MPAPTLSNIRIEDLKDRERLHSLHRQAVAHGWLRDCEADTLNFYAAAARARTVPGGDPVRVFVGIVRRRLWYHITQAQEDEARQLSRTSVEAAKPQGFPSILGDVMRSLLPPSVLVRMPVPQPAHPATVAG
jgi:hypothetical protein